jgi:pimeloyl-ACP methyl ester carboxylesterase
VLNEHLVRIGNGRRLAYFDLGDPGGVPAIHSHGAPSGKLETAFFNLDEAAKTAGVRLLCFDRPGIGGSDPDPGRSLLDWGRDVSAAAEALGIERFGLLGYSVGAASALACREHAPDRITATAVVSGIGPADVPGIVEGRSADVSRIFTSAVKAPWLTRLALRFMKFGTKNPQKMIAATGKGMPAADRVVADRPQSAEPFAAFLKDAMRQGVTGVLEDLQIAASPWGFTPRPGSPLAVWHGSADTNAPVAAARWLQSAVPDSVLIVEEGEGHISLLDRNASAVMSGLAELIRSSSRP